MIDMVPNLFSGLKRGDSELSDADFVRRARADLASRGGSERGPEVGDMLAWSEGGSQERYGRIVEIGRGVVTVHLYELVDGKLSPITGRGSKQTLDLTKKGLNVRRTSIAVAGRSEPTDADFSAALAAAGGRAHADLSKDEVRERHTGSAVADLSSGGDDDACSHLTDEQMVAGFKAAVGRGE